MNTGMNQAMTPSRITVRTDHGDQQLPEGSTLAQLLDHLRRATPFHDQAIATAVNGEFVPRGARAQYVLHEGDTVLCFAAITGG